MKEIVRKNSFGENAFWATEEFSKENLLRNTYITTWKRFENKTKCRTIDNVFISLLGTSESSGKSVPILFARHPSN
jgi:hypothetical protein